MPIIIMKKGLKYAGLFLVAILVLIFFLFLFRFFSSRQLDDVSPGIQCDKELLEKAEVLYIIPKFNNQSISENREWCNYILSLNKTLALHGVYHTYEEFKQDRTQSYLQEGIDEFEKCFGKKPDRFKPPQLAISKNNKELSRTNMNLDGYPNQILHKVYHCNDSNVFPNDPIRRIIYSNKFSEII